MPPTTSCPCGTAGLVPTTPPHRQPQGSGYQQPKDTQPRRDHPGERGPAGALALGPPPLSSAKISGLSAAPASLIQKLGRGSTWQVTPPQQGGENWNVCPGNLQTSFCGPAGKHWHQGNPTNACSGILRDAEQANSTFRASPCCPPGCQRHCQERGRELPRQALPAAVSLPRNWAIKWFHWTYAAVKHSELGETDSPGASQKSLGSGCSVAGGRQIESSKSSYPNSPTFVISPGLISRLSHSGDVSPLPRRLSQGCHGHTQPSPRRGAAPDACCVAQPSPSGTGKGCKRGRSAARGKAIRAGTFICKS